MASLDSLTPTQHHPQAKPPEDIPQCHPSISSTSLFLILALNTASVLAGDSLSAQRLVHKHQVSLTFYGTHNPSAHTYTPIPLRRLLSAIKQATFLIRKQVLDLLEHTAVSQEAWASDLGKVTSMSLSDPSVQ
jgi:hypothetical protein